MKFPRVPAVIFDLDGTLVETELLKAQSYAYAASEVAGCGNPDSMSFVVHTTPVNTVRANVLSRRASALSNTTLATSAAPQAESASHSTQHCADVAMAVFLSHIGGTSEQISREVVERLGLHDKLRDLQTRFNVDEPWRALYHRRKEIYLQRFGTDQRIAEARYERNIDMLHAVVEAGVQKVAVATSSKTEDAKRVLRILDVLPFLKVVNGADMVSKPKPDPEPYLKTAQDLGVQPQNCIVFEDSVNGVTAAVRAGTRVVALANEFTAPQLRAQEILDQQWIVYETSQLEEVVARRAAQILEHSS